MACPWDFGVFRLKEAKILVIGVAEAKRNEWEK